MSRLVLIVMATLYSAIEVFAQQQPLANTDRTTRPRKLDAPAIGDAQTAVQTYLSKIGSSSSYTVSGDQPFTAQTLAANVIVFNPDSTLRFVGTLGDRIDRYVVAQRIVVLPGGQSPPRITWGNDDNQRVPPAIGKAPSGGMSGSSSGEGSPGSPGDSGNAGYPGRSAPNVYLFVARIEGGPIMVDLRGHDGGKGGTGQAGGDGGPGRSGRPGEFTLFGCQHGGEGGGNGCSGGAGGNGGNGGSGGNGGTFLIVGREEIVEQLAKNFTVILLPGKPGLGGDPGPGGQGGPPGEGGGGSGPCSGGRPGSSGRVGPNGEAGKPGVTGEPGSFVTVELTGQQMKNLGLSLK